MTVLPFVGLGIHSMVSNAEYHADSAISASHLHAISRSPFTYYKRFIDPKRPAPEPSPAMRLGTFVHTAVLEPDDLDRRYAISSARRGTKAHTELINKGIEPVTQAQWNQAHAMCDAVRNHPEAAWLLSDGKAEQSVWWDDEQFDLRCKCRPDWWNGDIVIDLKTTLDASSRGFAKSVANFRYHVQQMHYLQGTKAARFIFIAVEKEYPFAVGVYELDNDACGVGEELRQRDMQRIKTCKQTNQWPGYSNEISTLSLPPYATNVEFSSYDF
jgi:hypothetical protein